MGDTQFIRASLQQKELRLERTSRDISLDEMRLQRILITFPCALAVMMPSPTSLGGRAVTHQWRLHEVYRR